MLFIVHELSQGSLFTENYWYWHDDVVCLSVCLPACDADF